ncbi:MAG: SUMF1/EgtB/PvdO family nonheme iron enzyme [Bacteroidota bacterium]|nr:SUMF1/EgtB/PvdO family nonheme iron enzyme [Bacteroidota bacterium]
MAAACSQHGVDEFVLVHGGPGKRGVVRDFYIGKYEVTQKEWKIVTGNNPSAFKGDELPVQNVSWYDCIGFCNERSAREGLALYYNIDKDHQDKASTNEFDSIRWTVTINEGANGYRLPTEAEWEYAAEGGRMSRGYVYSGSNHVDEVAWYWKNSGDSYLTGAWSWPLLVNNKNKPHPVGSRAPNELGLYDMSGNVREWCWDRQPATGSQEPEGRVWKGGGWMGADFCCAPSFRAQYAASGKGPDQGFRLCRSSGPGDWSKTPQLSEILDTFDR